MTCWSRRRMDNGTNIVHEGTTKYLNFKHLIQKLYKFSRIVVHGLFPWRMYPYYLSFMMPKHVKYSIWTHVIRRTLARCNLSNATYGRKVHKEIIFGCQLKVLGCHLPNPKPKISNWQLNWFICAFSLSELQWTVVMDGWNGQLFFLVHVWVVNR